MVENVARADLEPWLGQYAVRWELQPEQIQTGPLAEGSAGENIAAIPKLEELPLVKFWSDGSGAGLSQTAVYQQQRERLSGLLSRMSVYNLRLWFENAGERRAGKVGEHLLRYAMECEIEKNSVQALWICAEVLKEAYLQNRKAENGKEIFWRHLLFLAVFAEHYYNQDLLVDAECRAIPANIRAAYRMAVVLADGKPSHENVELLKQALAIFPPFHE